MRKLFYMVNWLISKFHNPEYKSEVWREIMVIFFFFTFTIKAIKKYYIISRNKICHIIIIMLRYQHRYSWPSLATPPYHLFLSADPQGYILYRHRAAVCRFKLDVLSLLVRVKGSTGVHHLWARPYFSSSILHVWFVLYSIQKQSLKEIMTFFL